MDATSDETPIYHPKDDSSIYHPKAGSSIRSPVADSSDFAIEHKDDAESKIPNIVDVLQWANSSGIKASDVHVIEGSPKPWIRRGGDFYAKEDAKAILSQEITAALELVGGHDMSHMLYIGGARWRSTAFSSSNGTRITYRRIPDYPPPLEQLGIHEQIRRLAKRQHGLIIASGATGSGKTTTLASLLNTINTTRKCHILTIEDPIEYIYPPGRALIAQRQVDVELYAKALQVALRSDINVVLLGECRTPEEFVGCMRLAATGHLVLTTMHALDCVTTCEIIISMTGTSGQAMLAQTMAAIVSQRLVPDAENPRRKHWVGETLINTPAYMNLLKPGGGGDVAQIRRQLQSDNASLDQTLAKMVHNRQITEAAAYAECIIAEDLQNYL